jgi:hypothetical protein
LSKFGTIVPRWVLKDVKVNHARRKGVLAVLLVADLIDDEQSVDKVAADSETFVRSERIRVGDQEFIAARDKLRALLVVEYLEAVDPGTRFGGGGFVVGVGGVLQRAHRMEIGEGELLHGSRGVRRKGVGGGGGGVGCKGTMIATLEAFLYRSTARTYTFRIGRLYLPPPGHNRRIPNTREMKTSWP